MNRGFAWFPPALRVSAALSGGKAPAGWLWDMVRKTAGLSDVRRGGAWVEEVGAIHPRLGERPLLGHALAALTEHAGQTPEPRPETPRSGKARFSQWEKPSERKRNKGTTQARGTSRFRIGAPDYPSAAKRKAPKEIQSASPSNTLSQFGAQADRLLLSRLAGSNIPFEAAERVETRRSSAVREGDEASFPCAHRDSAAQQDWLSRVARRARRPLGRQPVALAEAAERIQSGVLPSGQSRSPVEQWSMALDGQSASLELLNQLVDGDLPGQSNKAGFKTLRPRSSTSGTSPPPKPLSRTFWQSEGSPAFPDELTGRGVKGSGVRNGFEPKETLPDTSPVGSTFFAPDSGVTGQAGHGRHETKSGAPIIPPNVTPSLPDLLPPQRAGAPPLPVAAATARRGAREQAMMATDDLDMLAANIKHILDDQARRHGIDV